MTTQPTQPAQPQPEAAPGWYPDVRDGVRRYWDGTAWTGDVAPLRTAKHAAGSPAALSTRDQVILCMLLPLGLVLTAFDTTFGAIVAGVGALALAFVLVKAFRRP